MEEKWSQAMIKLMINRIQKMEERYDQLEKGVRALQAAVAECEGFKDNYKALKKYQKSGKWLKDYEADEQGKLPADLKRGVLSQDGLYNLLQDATGVLESLKDIR